MRLTMLLLLLPLIGATSLPASEKIDFNRDIRPILSDACFACHGPDEKHREGGLRLDVRESATATLGSGAIAIDPASPAASELLVRLNSTDADVQMPPPKSGKKVTAEQRALLAKWIEQGAPYAKHWSFVAPQRSALPEVKQTEWPRNEIDRFILARLEREGLQPSPPADKATILRRLSFDLIGLPPTPAEVAAFVNDPAENAYEKQVDRLFASPHYGERMAMAWLDGARYADSNGYQSDSQRFMWPWRDWVIEAYNNNMPFDQFTIEQLAGDLLPNATTSQRVATGFNRNHRLTTEGGSIAEEWRVETVIDRVEATSVVWLGLTAGCARCHDHKYDPLTQKEFYQLFAFFNNLPESGMGRDDGKNTPPTVTTASKDQETALAELVAKEQAARDKYKEMEKGKLPSLLAEWERELTSVPQPPEWQTVTPVAATAKHGSELMIEQNSAYVIASGKNPSQEVFSLRLPISEKAIKAIRVEFAPHEGTPTKGIGRSENGNIVMTDARLRTGDRERKFVSAQADFSQEGYPVAQVIDTNSTSGWAIFPKPHEPHYVVLTLGEPIAASTEGATVELAFETGFAQHHPAKIRVSVTDTTPRGSETSIPEAITKILQVDAKKRTGPQRKQLTEYLLPLFGGEINSLKQQWDAATKERTDFEDKLPTVMVMEEMPKPRDAFLLKRGQYDQRGEQVFAAIPAAFPPLPAGAPVNRLGFAQWLVSPEHPLTARVQVNRLWEKFFGIGLVKTSENMGSQAEYPSHPELLDWLAVEFRESGWNLKQLQKKIVMSATYRQASRVTPDLVTRDPENRLLARGPRFRLAAELIRDNALAIAGLLSPKVGGPAVRPYQPAGVWDETSVYGNLRNYKHEPGENLYRRTMYTIWKRTAAPPTMLMFDSPSREFCTVRRSRTNTPLQALSLLNEVTFVEAARALAQKTMLEGGSSTPERIAFAYRRAVGREPTARELAVLEAGWRRRHAKLAAAPDDVKKLLSYGDFPVDPQLDPIELATYTLTANVILNLDEVVTKE